MDSTQTELVTDAGQKLNLLKQLIIIDMNASKIAGEELKEKSYCFKIWTISMSVIVTIMLGLSLGPWWGDWGKNIALVFSAILTGLNTWNSFTKYEIRSAKEHLNTNKLALLLKQIILYETGINKVNYEEYLKFEQQYHLLLDEDIEERKSSNPPLDSNQVPDQNPKK